MKTSFCLNRGGQTADEIRAQEETVHCPLSSSVLRLTEPRRLWTQHSRAGLVYLSEETAVSSAVTGVDKTCTCTCAPPNPHTHIYTHHHHHPHHPVAVQPSIWLHNILYGDYSSQAEMSRSVSGLLSWMPLRATEHKTRKILHVKKYPKFATQTCRKT